MNEYRLGNYANDRPSGELPGVGTEQGTTHRCEALDGLPYHYITTHRSLLVQFASVTAHGTLSGLRDRPVAMTRGHTVRVHSPPRRSYRY